MMCGKELLKKYLYSDKLAQVNSKPSDSMFWKGLMKVKDDFFSRGSFEVENGRHTYLGGHMARGQTVI
jgi:hypothetical protein